MLKNMRTSKISLKKFIFQEFYPTFIEIDQGNRFMSKNFNATSLKKFKLTFT